MLGISLLEVCWVRVPGGYVCNSNIRWVSDEFLLSARMMDISWDRGLEPEIVVQWERASRKLGFMLRYDRP